MGCCESVDNIDINNFTNRLYITLIRKDIETIKLLFDRYHMDMQKILFTNDPNYRVTILHLILLICVFCDDIVFVKNIILCIDQYITEHCFTNISNIQIYIDTLPRSEYRYKELKWHFYIDNKYYTFDFDVYPRDPEQQLLDLGKANIFDLIINFRICMNKLKNLTEITDLFYNFFKEKQKEINDTINIIPSCPPSYETITTNDK